MATGIIQIDLQNPKSGSYYDEIKELVDKYSLGDHSLETINALILELIDDELMFYTEEDFSYSGLSKTMYNIVSQDTFIELQKNNILPSVLNYSLTMYGNFKYKDKKFTHPEGKDNYLDTNVPCMVYFEKNIVTFFILDEYGDVGII
ncbi:MULTISPECIES: hypothetical protein [unclassified Chryseobacterium]|uniref:hypothetical protein n=1 Tax=unclassified Chryseobacterium TaxID=2593645 RepID=UPI0021E5AF9E|nr:MULTISPECIES: hypothetical protein [unclassified Chryseobacterium]MEA1848050.1 hypothetical protein [Chryseobacterium sp. MHB01]